MFLAVEIFVVAQSVNVYIYLCVYYSLVWMCVENVDVLCVFRLAFFWNGQRKKKPCKDIL